MAASNPHGTRWHVAVLLVNLLVVLSLALSPAGVVTAAAPGAGPALEARGQAAVWQQPTGTAEPAPAVQSSTTMTPTATVAALTITPTTTITPTAIFTPTLTPTPAPTETITPEPTATAAITVTATPTPTPPVPAKLYTTEGITWTRIYAEQGGELVSDDSLPGAGPRVRVQFEPEDLATDIDAAHLPLTRTHLPPDVVIFYRFVLTARQADPPQLPLAGFAGPVTMTVAYTDTEVQDLLEAQIQLVRRDEAQQRWEPISSTLDTGANVVTAALTRTGEYGLLSTGDTFFQPGLEAGQVSLFTGDASYAYDLDVPAGANGLDLPLTLRYNSIIPNGMRCSTCQPQNDDNSDTGWLGVGWSMEVGKIEDAFLTMDGLWGRMQRPDWGTVVGELEHRCDWNGVHCSWGRESEQTWHLEQEKFARIRATRFDSCTDAACCDGQANCPSPQANRVDGLGKWQVWTPDGTRYVFGDTAYQPTAGGCSFPGGSTVDCGTGSRLYLTNASFSFGYKSWRLDRIVDTHGNRVDVEWTVFPGPPDGEGRRHLKESYPTRIRYTTNPAAGDSHAEYEVRLQVEPKDVDVKAEKKMADTGYVLRRVEVLYQPDASSPLQLVRAYDLDLADFDTPDYYLLERIVQSGLGGEQTLPATGFTYDLHQIGWTTDDGWAHTVRRPYLEKVENGYGGELDFGYAEWCLYDGQCQGGVGGGKRHVVETRTLSPGQDGVDITSSYSYADPGYVHDPDSLASGEFIGFRWAREDASDRLRRVESRFDHAMNGQGRPLDPLKGRLLRRRTGHYDGGTWHEFVETEYDWVAREYSGSQEDWPRWAYHVFVQEMTERSCGQGGCRTRKEAYAYRPASQGGKQYGNLTRIREYDSAEAETPYRNTLRDFFPNTERWIVDRLASEFTVAGAFVLDDAEPRGLEDGTAFTWYTYDGQDIHLTPPLTGDLTRVERLFDPEWQGAPGEFPARWQTSEARYGYDEFGNRTTATTFTDYGQLWQDNGDIIHEVIPQRSRTITTTFDTAHHSFPLQITDPLGHRVTSEYYGVDGVEVSEGGFPGLLKSVTDVENDDTTTFRYDAFGRGTHTWQPDDVDEASTIVEYDDAARRLYTRQRDDDGSGPATYLESWQFYDGLGRPVQSQAESEDPGEIILGNQLYDRVGRLHKESVPHRVTAAGGIYQEPDWSQPRSTYVYDGAGRVLLATAPDNTAIQTAYDGWSTITTDPNGRHKVHDVDAFDRLASVVEDQVGEQVTLEDDFSTMDQDVWVFSGHQSLEGDTLKNTGTGDSYDADFYRTAYDIGGGDHMQGIEAEFKLGGADTGAVFGLEQVSPLRRFGVLAEGGALLAQYWAGHGWIENAVLIEPVEVDVWYVLRLRVNDHGQALIQVWEKDDASVYGAYAVSMTHGAVYGFHSWVYRDEVWLNLYREFDQSLVADAQTTTYQYDEGDNLVGVTDTAGNQTAMTYNLLDRKLTMDDPDMGFWQYGYDGAGNLVEQTDAKSQTITFEYDDLDRLTRKDYPSGDPAVYEYDDVLGDGLGANSFGRLRLSYVGEPSDNAHLYAYDDRGRLAEETVQIDGDAYGTSYAYDKLDRVTTTDYPGGEAVHTAYNEQGLPTSLSGDSDYVSAAAYNALGQRTLLDTGPAGGALTQYRYYGEEGATTPEGYPNLPSFRLMEIESVDGGGTPRLNLQYGYDPGGNVQALWDQHGQDGQPESWDYAYDFLDRLTGATGSYDAVYEYMPIGNMTSKTEEGVTYVMEYDDPDHVHAPSSVNGEPLEYDPNGNMTLRNINDDTYTQTWDHENRLVGVVNGSATITFTYDAGGALVKKETAQGATHYVGQHYERALTPAQAIGEVGQIDDALTHVPQTVVLSRSYVDPVVFAAPLSRDGIQPAVVRVTDVQADRFTLYVQEAPGGWGWHTTETVSWLVLESGTWQVSGGRLLEVGKVSTDDTVGQRVDDEWGQVGFSPSFAETPVVLTQVQSENDAHWVSTRQLNASTTGFQVALEEDEAQDEAHGEEVIGWLAMEPGLGTWDGHAFEAVHTADSIRSLPTLVSFQQTYATRPRFLGSLATRDSEDNAHLRYRALTAGGLLLRVEEDRTWDAEMFHGTEAVDYLAIEGDGLLTAEAAESQTWYYYFAGQRVAMRQGDLVFFIVGDHLGTTSLVLDEDEVFRSETRHYPYGTERWADGTVPTDYRFTGQQLQAQIGLYHMGARFYEPRIGQFISPDSIVPRPGNPQSFDRYSYSLSNPLKYRDPSGRWVETAWDIANIAWDIYEVKRDPSVLNVAALVVDVAAVALPAVPAGAGLIARGGKAAKIVAHGDEAVEVATALSHTDEAADAARVLEEGLQRASKEATERSFREFTRRNFRENLRRLTGRTTEGIKGLEAHHVLPDKFVEDFARAGIENIHDPKLGTWVGKGPHRGWSHRYNQEWRGFFQRFERQGTVPTERQILEHALEMAKDYGFEVNFIIP